jgi:transcriptional regulator with XRE-family HTH domain
MEDQYTDQLEFGYRLGDLLNQREMKQNKLAARLGVTQAAVSNWITGKSDPGARHLKQIAVFFDVSTDWLVGMPREGKAKRAASRATGLSAEAVETLAKNSDPINARARDQFVTSGTFDLVTKYIEKVRYLSLQLGTFAKLSAETIDSPDKLQSQILMLKLALLESKETRAKLLTTMTVFLNEYTDFEAIEEAVEKIVEKQETFLERFENNQEKTELKNIPFDEI